MPTIQLQGTEFTCGVQTPKNEAEGAWVRLRLSLKNEYLEYDDTICVLIADVEEWLFSMSRLLAGGYAHPYSISFENTGVAVDLYPCIEDMEGKHTRTRAERRESTLAMALRILMRSQSSRRYLGGVYTLLLGREEIAAFVRALRWEFYSVYSAYAAGKGEHAFVGVSPLGYQGCNYWYYDETGEVKSGDYVFVRMGKNATEQIVFVDCARRFSLETAPYDPKRVKRVLRKATAEEVAVATSLQK
jgi:hypothetical protein